MIKKLLSVLTASVMAFTALFVPAVFAPLALHEDENFNLFESEGNFWKGENWAKPSGITNGVLSLTDGYATYIGTALDKQTVSFVMQTSVQSGALQFYFRNSVSAESVAQSAAAFSEKNGGNPYVLTYSAETGRILFKSYTGNTADTLYGKDGISEVYIPGLNDGNPHTFCIETAEDALLSAAALTLYIDGKNVLEVCDDTVKGMGYMSFAHYSGGTFEISSLTVQGITSDPAVTANLVCGFEEENLINGNVSITSAEAHSGTSSLFYDDSVSGNSFFTMGGVLQKALIAGQAYRVTAWVKPAGSGKSIEFSFRENSSGGKISGGTETDIKTSFSYYGLNNSWIFLLDEDKTTGWQKVLLCNEYVPSDNTRYPYFRLYSYGSGDGWYIDDVCFESVLDCTLNTAGDASGTLSYTNHSYLLADTNAANPLSALSVCKGDRITVTAAAAEDSVFSGWYDCDFNLLTKESNYTYIASENTVFNAVFSNAPQGQHIVYDFENTGTDIIGAENMSVSNQAAYSGNYGVNVRKTPDNTQRVWSVIPAASDDSQALDSSRKYRVSVYVKSNSEQTSGQIDLTLYFASVSNTTAYGNYTAQSLSLSRWGITQGHIKSIQTGDTSSVSAEEWNKVIICDEFTPQENGIYPVLTVYANVSTAFDWYIDRLEFCELTDTVCQSDNAAAADVSYVKNTKLFSYGSISEDNLSLAVGDSITPVTVVSEGYYLKGLYVNGVRVLDTAGCKLTVSGTVYIFAVTEKGCNLIDGDSRGWLISQQYGGSAVLDDTLSLKGRHATATYTGYKIRNHTVTVRYIADIENEWAGIMLRTDADKQFLEENPGKSFSADTNPYVISITQKRTTLRKFDASGEIDTLYMPDVPSGAIPGYEHELKITCLDGENNSGAAVTVCMDGREIISYTDRDASGAAGYISFICMSADDNFTVTYFGVDGVDSDKWSEIGQLCCDIDSLGNIDVGSGDIESALRRFETLSALDRELIGNSSLLETASAVYNSFCENELSVHIPAVTASSADICTSQKRALRFFGRVDSAAVREYEKHGFKFASAGMAMLPADKTDGSYTLKTENVKACTFSADDYGGLSSYNVYLNGFDNEIRAVRSVSAKSFAVFEKNGITLTVYSSGCALQSLYNAAVKRYNTFGHQLEFNDYNGLYALTLLEGGAEDAAYISFSQPNGDLLDGIGAELDPHIFRSVNTDNGFNEEDWQLICRRIKTMGLDKIRMMIMPEWYEPENENDDPFDTDMNAFSWDNQDMNAVYRVLDMAEEYGIKVNITVWGANASAGSWLAYGEANHWISPPNDLDEWNENISALLVQLIKVKKYTCITELTPYNEPADAYYITSPSEISFENYKQMVLSLHNRLVSDGVRDLIMLCTSDDGTKPAWLEQCVSDRELSAVSDCFNSHCYKLSENATLSQTEEYADRLLGIALPGGKRFTLNEFGSSTFGGGDYTNDGVMDTYARGMLYGKMITKFLGAGCAGMLHWCLFDQYYGTDKLMYRGLWKYRDSGWENRPIYYALSVISANTVPGSEIYKGTSSDASCASTAFKAPDGTRTYIAVNESDRNRVIRLENSQLTSGAKIYIYSEYTLRLVKDDMLPLYAVTQAQNASVTVVLPANSFAVVVCD